MKPLWQSAVCVIALAILYFCAGSFGLSLASINPSASAVWPPSGIALAAILLWGYRYWPGVFSGAFLVNLTAQGSIATATSIACGNTLEALLGAWLVNRFAGGPKAFSRTRNILLFILLAAILSTSVAATVGVASLSLAGYAKWGNFADIWLTWWFGDMVGDLIVAPLLVLWLTQPLLPVKSDQLLESGGLLLMLILVGWGLFLRTTPSGLEYFALAPLLWAALRFGRRGAVTSAFAMSGIALWGTWRNLGPFSHFDTHESLLLLQLFMATVTVTALVMASVVSERKLLEQRLRIKDAISRILAQADTMADAAPKIIRVLCETSGWDLGAIWKVERASGEMTCLDFWSLPALNAVEFEAVTRQMQLPPGVDLPERVCNTAKPIWFHDVTHDNNFPRTTGATIAGLRSAVGFPIMIGQQVLCVVEFFNREIKERDDDFLEMVGGIGAQLGQFLERKLAEEAVRLKERQLRVVTGIAPVLLAQCSRDLKHLFVNRAYADLFGRTPEQIVGRSIVEVLGAQAYEKIHPYVESVLHGRTVECETELPFERIGRRFMHVAYVPETDERGNVVGWVSAISDITQRKQAEAALQQAKDDLAKSNEYLERRVLERTADLERAKAALLRDMLAQKALEEQLRQAQKMESLGTLTGGVAHDFNNILNIIRSHASLMGEIRNTDQEFGIALKTIDETIGRGAAIVQQLLAIARKSDLKFEQTDVNNQVARLERLIVETFPKTIRVGLNLDPRPPIVSADPNQLDQVLLNIALNARDAMPDGGSIYLTTATVAGTELRKTFQEAHAERYAEITVMDSGHGMNEAVRQRIFEPFFSTKSRSQGTGLGLSVAYGIVTNHRGFIDATSQPNQGAAFNVYLPINDWSCAELDQKPQRLLKHPGGQSKEVYTILFVEDEIRQVELMRRLLERNGYRVLTATDGVEAVETYRQHKHEISLVLLDLGLPRLNGWEALKKMQQINPNLKAILATGYISAEIETAISIGNSGTTIMKPYQLGDILNAVSAVLMSSTDEAPATPY